MPGYFHGLIHFDCVGNFTVAMETREKDEIANCSKMACLVDRNTVFNRGKRGLH